MKTFADINEMVQGQDFKGDYLIPADTIDQISALMRALGYSSQTDDFYGVFGGDFHIIETTEELSQMLDSGLPDICGPSQFWPGMYDVVFMTNNAGGPTYFVSTALPGAYKLLEETEKKINEQNNMTEEKVMAEDTPLLDKTEEECFMEDVRDLYIKTFDFKGDQLQDINREELYNWIDSMAYLTYHRDL